jgi:hypothetical protein
MKLRLTREVKRRSRGGEGFKRRRVKMMIIMTRIMSLIMRIGDEFSCFREDLYFFLLICSAL